MTTQIGRGGHRRGKKLGPIQEELRFERKWGGRRANAGRPRLLQHQGVPHRARPEHNARNPVHVTLRVVRRLPSLRLPVLFSEVRRALGSSSRRAFRLVHFSVQTDHIHLVAEAHDKIALARGARGLCIRLARAINAVLGRKGQVFDDRYHARSLSTPREVRNAIVYVLQNWLKHLPGARGVDRYSSGWWFTGWRVPPTGGPPDWDDHDHAPVRLPLTWLGNAGWRRHGLVDPAERPKAP